MATLNGGPYLNAAVLCEKVLQEKDETISIIRIIDRVTVTAAIAMSPEKKPPAIFNLMLLISLRSGNAKGRHTVKCVIETPSGLQLPEQPLPALFEGEDRGVNLILNFHMPIDQEGVYWFDILLEDQLLTRIPLRVLYQCIGQQAMPLA